MRHNPPEELLQMTGSMAVAAKHGIEGFPP